MSNIIYIISKIGREFIPADFHLFSAGVVYPAFSTIEK